MQTYTSDFAKKNLTPQAKEVKIGKSSYRADIAGETGWILEKAPKGQKKYRIGHTLGGKNVYYFLTPFPRGRLQTLPLAYDVKKREWSDTAASGVRHFPGAEREQPVSWLDPAYTFITSCYSGLGGLTTVLDVKVNEWPTHAVGKHVALLPNCAATRHAHFVLDGSGPVHLAPPSLDEWPKLALDFGSSRRVNLDTITKAEIATWKAGDRLLLNGRLLTGRDPAHKRIVDMIASGEKLPVDFRNRFIYYVGPVDAVRDEAVGPAGPTTASRMDRFTDTMLAKTGLIGMVGKSERGSAAIEAIGRHGAAYSIAVGGAAYLVSKAIKGARVLAFADLGMEAIREFDVVDMPVTVAVDAKGGAVHRSGPAEWRAKIGKIPVVTA